MFKFDNDFSEIKAAAIFNANNVLQIVYKMTRKEILASS